MKKTMSVYLPLVCLAVILSSAKASTPVLDSNGDEVRAGVTYRIDSFIAIGHVPQTLKLGVFGNQLCPLDVVLAGFHECFHGTCGLPVNFYPEEGSVVNLSEDVNIKFDATTECPESTVWQVVHDESDREYVSTGGELGPRRLSSSWFRIRSAGLVEGNVYELVYCNRLQNLLCGTLGFDSQGTDPRFFVQGQLGATPFRFVIRKYLPLLSSVV